MIAQATRAVRFAIATVTTRAGRRSSIVGMRESTEAGAVLARVAAKSHALSLLVRSWCPLYNDVARPVVIVVC